MGDKMETITEQFTPSITVFHCNTAINPDNLKGNGHYTVKSVVMPCSSITREMVLMKAFEAGSDAVVVLTCPEGQCKYVEGNLRSKKRVEHVKKILDEVGINGNRLSFYNLSSSEPNEAIKILETTAADVAVIGRNPAAW